MKKLLAILMCLVILTGCSNNQTTQNNENINTDKKNEVYQEIEKQKEEENYTYQNVTLVLKSVIANNDELKKNKGDLENVFICDDDISMFIYFNKKDINIYSIKEDKLYSEKEINEFDLTNWCKDKHLFDLQFNNQREIDYLKK